MVILVRIPHLGTITNNKLISYWRYSKTFPRARLSQSLWKQRMTKWHSFFSFFYIAKKEAWKTLQQDFKKKEHLTNTQSEVVWWNSSSLHQKSLAVIKRNVHQLSPHFCGFIISFYLNNHAEMKKKNNNNRGLGVYQIMLASKVSWLRIMFSWNHLKCPEILNRVKMGNVNSKN